MSNIDNANQENKYPEFTNWKSMLASYFQEKDALVRRSDEYKEMIGTSSTNLAGTVTALDEKIESISREIAGLANNHIPEIVNSRLTEITKDINFIKETVVPDLERTKKVLENVDCFLNEKSTFLIDLISAEGRLQAIQGEINSIMPRINNLEQAKEKKWQKTVTIISLFVAIGAVVVAIIF
jgi:hypothetical protein